MAGLTQNYTTPYALTMGATTQQVGFLASIPNLIMSLAQLAAPGLSDRAGGRKRLVLLMALMHAVMFLPILIIPYVFGTQQVWWLIGFLTLGTAFDAVSQPPWGSMMADLVPMELRGRFFGGRNRIAGFIAMVFSYIAGGILQLLTTNTNLAFSIIFAGAIVSRLTSLYFLAQMNEPLVPAASKNGQDGLLRITRNLFSSNIGRFTVFHSLINFTATIAGPFFAPYMLRELKFDYITYAIINSASTLSTIGFMTWWGKRTDKAGNIRVLQFTSFLIPFVPIGWLVSRDFYWILVVQVFSGFIWAGFQLASSVFLFDASPPENRTRHIAIYNTLMYLGVSLGSLTGGILSPFLPEINGSYFLTIFLVSGIARLAVVFVFAPHISEVRDVPLVSIKDLVLDGFTPADIRRLPSIIRRRINRFWKR
jgi:MFS family permease